MADTRATLKPWEKHIYLNYSPFRRMKCAACGSDEIVVFAGPEPRCPGYVVHEHP